MGASSRRPQPAALVLVVDPHEDCRELYARFLSESGYLVVRAATSDQGFDRAAALGPEVIVIDLPDPDPASWDILRRFSVDDRTRDARVIVVSGWAGEAFADRARTLGCAAFLEKPCPLQTLAETIQRVRGAGRPTA